MRTLIVTADDFGLTRATSEAIVDAHRNGIVTATSLLANGPALSATAALLRPCPDLEIGVHLALVGEDPPISDPGRIPTLVDEHGRLPSSWRSFLRAIAARRISVDDVSLEIEAQVEHVTRIAGRQPTFLNAHQHLQLWPSIGAVLATQAVRSGVGFVRTPRSNARSARGGAIAVLARWHEHRCRSMALATTDGFLGLDEAGAWDGARLQAAIRRSGHQTLEINVHPGAAEDRERDRYRWGYGWGGELAALVDPATRRAVEESGLRLAGPSEVTGAPGTHP
jgi:predicted glycoside hydrolase/deacetylase ChbG (UPF0249 family)